MALDSQAGDASFTPAEAPKRQIILLQPVFEGSPSVILFTYTKECGAVQRCLDRAVWADLNGPKLYYVLTNTEFNAVINSMRHGGLYRIKDGSSRFCVRWSMNPTAEVLRSLTPIQRVNSFPACQQIGRKDLLWQNVHKMQKRFGEAFDIHPKSYNFPMGLARWKHEIAKSEDSLWIWKPAATSCGRGIKVFSSAQPPDEVKRFAPKRGVIQQYIRNPLLIHGFKFDLRVYVVVLSFEPLKLFLNDEGFVRLATTKFDCNCSTLDSQTMHLTNYAINKLSKEFVQNQDCGFPTQAGETEEAKEDVTPSKWSFAELRRHFSERQIDNEAVWQDIGDVIIKTAIACEPPIRSEWSRMVAKESDAWISMSHGAHPASCFQVLGFDIILDEVLKPWLLEVNVRPSFSSGSPLDKRIKTKLVADSLTLVGIQPPADYRHESLKRSFSEMAEDSKVLGPDKLNSKAAIVAALSPLAAVEQFDDAAWAVVLSSVEEDMRSGGLRRIFPSAHTARYLPFMGKESFASIVLRKWYEAGGVDLFANSKVVPPSVIPARFSVT